MSGMYGADVAQLRALAQQFDRSAEQLDANRMTVGNAIRISAWVGPTAVRFRHQWDSEHSRKVQAAAVRLREASHLLRANADDQERTSAVGAASASGARGGTNRPDGRSIADFAAYMLPTLERSYELLTKADSYLNLVDVIRLGKLGSRIPGISIITSGYELIRQWPETWDDIQSGDIWRFGKAIFRTGYTAAKAIPLVGAIDAAFGLGIDGGRMITDGIFGQGATDRAFEAIGRNIDGIGTAINDAGKRAGAKVAGAITGAAGGLLRLFGR